MDRAPSPGSLAFGAPIADAGARNPGSRLRLINGYGWVPH